MADLKIKINKTNFPGSDKTCRPYLLRTLTNVDYISQRSSKKISQQQQQQENFWKTVPESAFREGNPSSVRTAPGLSPPRTLWELDHHAKARQVLIFCLGVFSASIHRGQSKTSYYGGNKWRRCIRDNWMLQCKQAWSVSESLSYWWRRAPYFRSTPKTRKLDQVGDSSTWAARTWIFISWIINTLTVMLTLNWLWNSAFLLNIYFTF